MSGVRDHLRAYWVMFRDADWACMVVAFSHSQAKQLFWRYNPAGQVDIGDYTDIRARLARKAQIPDSVERPQLFDGCSDAAWICDANDPTEFCCECAMPAAKIKAQRYNEEQTP